jgi:hypothetical protein
MANDYLGSPRYETPVSPVPDLVDEVYERRKDAGKHQGEWRRDAREDYEFLSGEQWDASDRAKLEEQGRPVVVFNRVGPIIKSVVGLEINNRQRIVYKPRTFDDAKLNEIYTEGARYVRDQCDAEDEESDAFRDAATCGMGWLHTYVDYEEDPDGQITLMRVPPLEMRWDPSSRKRNLSDAKWLLREKRWTMREIRERWPDKADDITPTPDVIDDELEEHDATEAWKYEQDQGWLSERFREARVTVMHYQWRTREAYYRVGDPMTGRVVEFDSARFNRLRDRLDDMGTPYVKQYRWKYEQAFIAGNVILEQGDCPIEGFTYRCITAERDEANGTWYGLMRAMKDPQRWANKWLAQAMHVFNANSKGGVLVESSAVEDMREFEENWASADGVVVVEDGALTGGRIQQKDFGGYPSALDKLLTFAITSVRDCVGVNLEMLGMADRQQARVLELERKKAALTILAPLMASLQHYRRQHGRDLLQFMRRYIPPGTMVRVTGREDYMQWQADPEHVQYDVIVDTAPDSPNLKEEVWQQLSEMVPSLLKAGVPLPPDLIRFSPLPAHVAEQWTQYIQERTGGLPKEAKEQMEKMGEEIKKLRDENESLKTKERIRMLEVQARMQNSQLDREQEAKQANADRVVELFNILQDSATTREQGKQADINNAMQLAELVARRTKERDDRELKEREIEVKRAVGMKKQESTG